MKEGTKIINKHSNKEAEFIRRDGAHVWIRIDGIDTPTTNINFNKVYEVKK